MTAELRAIDPALEQLGQFSRLSSGTVPALHAMRQRAIFTDGVVPAAVKAMAAVLWAVSARCEPCLRYYAHKARELGATAEQLGELLAVASVMGGCVGEMWALKAFHAFGDTTDHPGPACNDCCADGAGP